MKRKYNFTLIILLVIASTIYGRDVKHLHNDCVLESISDVFVENNTSIPLQGPPVTYLGAFYSEFRYSDTRNTVNGIGGFKGFPFAETNFVVNEFTLEKDMDVVISHCGSEISETYINLYKYSGNDMSTWSESDLANLNCSPSSTSLRCSLPPGKYAIISRGKKENGNIKISITGLEGNSIIIPEPNGNIFELGTFNDEFSLCNEVDSYYMLDTYRPSSWIWTNSPKDIHYRFTLNTPMSIDVINSSELGSLSMYIVQEKEDPYPIQEIKRITSQKDASIENFLLSNGIYRVIVEGGLTSNGYTIDGLITTTIKGKSADKHIEDLGDLSQRPFYSGNYTDKCPNADGDSSRYQVYCQFKLSRKMDFTVSLDIDSGLENINIYLLNEEKKEIYRSGDFLRYEDLDQGNYYLVIEGSRGNGRLLTYIRADDYKDDFVSSTIRNNNYILTRNYTRENSSRSLTKIDYYDGLGRPIQSISLKGSPRRNDMVTLLEYDNAGRLSKEWLPRMTTASTGLPVSSESFKSLSPGLYYNDSAPYSTPVYEASPLNRVLEQYGPGEAWQTNRKSAKSAYLTNIIGGDTLNCIYYTTTLVRDSVIQVSYVDDYKTGELYVTRVEDEDGRASFEFKDKLGQVILTRQVQRNGGAKTFLDPIISMIMQII